MTLEDLDTLQWVLQHCNISNTDPTPSPWPPAGETGTCSGPGGGAEGWG